MSKPLTPADAFVGNRQGIGDDGRHVRRTVELILPYLTASIELAEARGLMTDGLYLRSQRALLEDALKQMDFIEHELYVAARQEERDRGNPEESDKGIRNSKGEEGE